MSRTRPFMTLLGGLLLLAPAGAQAPKEGRRPGVPSCLAAWLGMKTRAPTRTEARRLSLSVTVRIQGQVIREVTPKGPADRAGLAPGDVILGLGASSIFSRDDIEDLLRVSRPGQKLAARVIRGKTSQRETVTLELGGRKASPRSGIPWEHAGLVQLRSAQARARKDRRRVLVGLSGAET